MENRFRIIAYRSLMPDGIIVDSPQHLSISSRQKKMFGKGWLYFYDGYKIEEKDNSIFLDIDDHIDDDALLLRISEKTTVSICAIVGENGSGKSSLVDMIIRIMNNVSAAAFGEEYNNDTSEHLFFIDDVYGCLLCFVDGCYYLIEVAGRSVKIGRFYSAEGKQLLLDTQKREILTDNEKVVYSEPIGYKKPNIIKLENLFYTVVYNYSLYSFNFHDYYNERTLQNRWNKADFDEKEDKEDNVWLKGLFHKNDGYMVPIVLNPMREGGLINVPKENKLAKERQLSLLMYRVVGPDGVFSYPLRTINKNKVIVGVKLESTNTEYTNTYILKNLGYKESDFKAKFKVIKEEICSFWRSAWKIPRPKKYDANVQKAWNYVVYKTLKICSTYDTHCSVIAELQNKRYNRWRLECKLFPLFMDESHITVKLRRTLAYLKYGIYGKSDYTYYMNHIEGEMYRVMKRAEKLPFMYGDPFDFHADKKKTITLTTQDLLPPPIFKFSFVMMEKEKINDRHLVSDEFLFEGLSSGERQVAYSISNFMYHLVNIDSVHECKDSKPGRRVRYHNVFAIFDEVELYFHPDLQRRYLDLLLASLQNAHLKNITGINIMMVTHSPFVLSDLPKSNILFLGDSNKSDIKETFCSNIHEMLSSSFFMDYSIGEIGRIAIEEIVSLYNSKQNQEKYEYRKNKFTTNRQKYRYVARHIGDEFLSKYINGTLDELEREFDVNALIEEEIAALNERIRGLEAKLHKGKKK